MIDLVEPADHVVVGGINRAAANGIMRVVADEQFPGLVNDRSRVSDAAGFLLPCGRGEGVLPARLQFRPGGKWLHPAFEQILRVIVALLDPHPGGKNRR